MIEPPLLMNEGMHLTYATGPVAILPINNPQRELVETDRKSLPWGVVGRSRI